MSLAAFSYFRNSIPVPQHEAPDFGTTDGVPQENASRLRGYIFDQQMISFRTAAPFFFPSWPWMSDQEVLRQHLDASIAEFDRLRAIVDAGRFSQIGLRSSERGNLLGHQVLAYGYEVQPRRIIHYDPNFPNRECHFVLDPANGRAVQQFADGTPTSSRLAYASFFIAFDLDPGNPGLLNEFGRPPYIDLAIVDGVAVSQPVGDGLRQAGERLEVSATVRNLGDHPSRFRELLLWARSPGGRNRDADLGVRAPVTRLAPGEAFRFHRVFERFGDEPGFYQFGVSILSLRDQWIILPPQQPPARSSITIELVPGQDRSVGTGGFRGPGVYRIRARHSGKVLDVDTSWWRGGHNGQRLIQWDWHGGANQQFRVEDRGNGEWALRPQHAPNKAIDVDTSQGTSVQAPVQQWDFHGGANQKFRIEPAGDHYRIAAVHSGLVLDVEWASGALGARLIQSPWWGGNNQLFQFERL